MRIRSKCACDTLSLCWKHKIHARSRDEQLLKFLRLRLWSSAIARPLLSLWASQEAWKAWRIKLRFGSWVAIGEGAI